MVYILEDDESIRELVCYSLNNSGIEAEGFGHPSEFWSAFDERMPELAVLDIMLPDEDGISVLKRIREQTKDMPVVMLSAKDTEHDKVMGLDLGADDYISKPFSMMEFIARIKALLRRTCERCNGKYYRVGKLYVSADRHVVKVGGNPVTLTLKEFETLCFLLENKGAVMSRDEILSTVWGYSFDGENRTVDVHIRSLRGKLGEAGSLIETVRGIGYKISDE